MGSACGKVGPDNEEHASLMNINPVRNWVVKASVQKLISAIPGEPGFRVNETVTRMVRGGVANRVKTVKRFVYAMGNMHLLQDKTGFSFSGAKILEWGTGWHGIDLILFYLLGADKIVTLDHSCHLTLAAVQQQIVSLKREKKVWETSLGPKSLDRWEALETVSRQAGTLPDLLQFMGIAYHLHRNYPQIRPPRAYDDKFDLFYSNSVLQRIAEDDLNSGLSTLSMNHMKAGACFFHAVDQSDIHAMLHADRKLWRLAYLRYSDFFYNRIISCRFNNQNRLRESDFTNMFRQVGFHPVYLRSYYSREDLDRMKVSKPNDRFLGKSALDLAVSHTDFIGVVQKDQPHRTPAENYLIAC